MSNTPNFGLPRPVEDANVDDEFRRLQDAWDLLDAILTVFQVGIAGKSSLGHVHTISQINGLAAELAKKMDAGKSFAIGDLSDVVGAAQAALGYVLAKSANGFTFQSAASLLGAHQHKVNEIVGLAEELLDLGRAVSEKAATTRVNELQSALNELAIAAAGVPIGTIIDVYGNGTTTPPGFLKVVPGLEITTLYPELRAWALTNGWAVNGAGNPVFPSTAEALFKRQWRAGQATRDAGRAFGTVQADQLQGHGHVIGDGLRQTNSFSSTGPVLADQDGGNDARTIKAKAPISDGVNGAPRVGSETRPANITVTWFIRAYNSPLDTATLNAARLVDDVANARARVASLERKFTSTPQIWVALGSISLDHGLDVVPGDVVTKIVNINAEHGYSPGDTVMVNYSDDIASSYGGASITVDAKIIFFRFGNGNYVVAHKTTGARAGCSPANWRLIVEARP